ncbi:MAG: hypothetical protein NTU76_04650, partial [Candidatus Taylorbacteria bacterium]|nr:hypothetical protein [Candidatus Taylorbacteria bacterium]
MANKTTFNEASKIIVKGARTHNLKNITVEMPRNKMIAVTGLSGSGKSSFAFDTIFAEGQRRYVESLSSYARQFLHQMQKPDVDEIIGLSPAISIDQKSRSNNPRSTVATITEIYDYLRILFARIGKPHCLECGREIKKLSKEEILETIINTVSKIKPQEKLKEVLGVEINSNKIRIFSPVVVGRKGEYYQLLYDLLEKGYEQVKIDGEMKKLRNQIILAKNKKHDIDVLVDEFYVSEFINQKTGMDPVRDLDFLRAKASVEIGSTLVVQRDDPSQIKNQFDGAGRKDGLPRHARNDKKSKEINIDIKTRLSDAVEKAIEESKGLLKIETPEETKMISVKFMCPYDGYSYPEIEPRLFSFNSPYGACPECNGLGTKEFFSDEPCEKCKGARLREEALHIFIGGQSIVDYTAKSITDAKKFLEEIKFTELEQEISKVILKEIDSRLE